MIGFLLDRVRSTRRFVIYRAIETEEDDVIYLSKAKWEALGKPMSITVEIYPEVDEPGSSNG